MSDLLRVEGLHVSFGLMAGRIDAVRGVSFRVPVGGTVALVGESGSGKSVTGQAIMGILPRAARIDGGKILFDDPKVSAPGSDGSAPVDIAALSPRSPEMRALRGDRISIIFQEPMTSLSPVHTVGDQVGEALRLHRDVTRTEATEITRDMLRLVGFPDPQRALTTYPFELSGGLRQRAMIAMALICRPSLLVADEPTTALDVTIQAQILKLIRDLQSELGMAVLMITHDLGVVANVAEEVVVMYRGRVVESGPRGAIFDAPRHPYLKALMGAVPRFDMGPGERLRPLREVPHRSSSRLWARDATERDGQPVDGRRPLLTVAGLTKTFGLRKSGWFAQSEQRITAVDDVSFTIRRGECLGLVGESGCGKSTVSKAIMRAITPDSGRIVFNDRGEERDVLALEGAQLDAYRRKVQYIFQDPFSALNPRMTVADILGEPFAIHGIGDKAWRREMIAELMQVVGLEPKHLQRYPHSFSGGQRQRIGIARALALKPDLLICDEPVSALDVSIQAQILNLLRDLQQELGLTYLFISHNLAVVDYLADRIAVMCKGELVELAPREMLFRDPRHPYTRALLQAVPAPDPNRRLDLGALLSERVSDPAHWPAPFGHDGRGKTPPQLIDLGRGHFVRATHVPQPVEATP
ncbi:ABC transporter ATP-binding protein [Rhodovibrio salinarum]|uniref:ABC transporter ATP-binding protein n=1 Tax=Rhodovibrio salinarum TaxID=1087 RepID=A0A934UZ61_9PROT|nr:ABC transporter ATP-binding protein [Rhodovibrio salinarum]MBK1696837.1 ABC transporter ATP-binding protein [Rhodovibrio salinarum]